MPALIPTEFTASVIWLGRNRNRAAALQTEPLDRVVPGFGGV